MRRCISACFPFQFQGLQRGGFRDLASFDWYLAWFLGVLTMIPKSVKKLMP